LTERASQLGLAEPLALACHFCVRWLATPVPPATQAAIRKLGPGWSRRVWLLPLFETALAPVGPDDLQSWKASAADAVLLARYHRGRLPLGMLVTHVRHKLWARGRHGQGPEAAGAGP
jgi:hypothetical protein